MANWPVYGITVTASSNPWTFSKDTQIENPSTTPVYADGNWEDACPGELDAPPADLWRGAGWLNQKGGHEMGRIAIQRHGGGAAAAHNYTANWNQSPPSGGVDITTYDGHAELAKLPTLWKYTWHHAWGQTQTPAIGNSPSPYQ